MKKSRIMTGLKGAIAAAAVIAAVGCGDNPVGSKGKDTPIVPTDTIPTVVPPVTPDTAGRVVINGGVGGYYDEFKDKIDFASWKPVGMEGYVASVKDGVRTDYGYCPIYTPTGQWGTHPSGYNSLAKAFVLLPGGIVWVVDGGDGSVCSSGAVTFYPLEPYGHITLGNGKGRLPGCRVAGAPSTEQSGLEQ
jgi:hypothetical protein